MIKLQDKAREIKRLQERVLPELKQQLADTKGIFKGKERKASETSSGSYRRRAEGKSQYERPVAWKVA